MARGLSPHFFIGHPDNGDFADCFMLADDILQFQGAEPFTACFDHIL